VCRFSTSLSYKRVNSLLNNKKAICSKNILFEEIITTSFRVFDIFRSRSSIQSNGAKIDGTRRNKTDGTERC
jgi:hypothetical protein